jgi:hypothetical protein
VVTWCIRPPDFDRAIAVNAARKLTPFRRAKGGQFSGGADNRDGALSRVRPGANQSMSRRTAEGTLLTWRLTPVTAVAADGLVPFLIDWGSTAHPTSGAMPTLPLSSFAGEAPPT